MEKKKTNPKKKVKFIFRPAPVALKVAVCLLIVSSIGALAALRWVHNGIQDQTQVLTQEAAQAQRRGDELQEKIDNLDSVQSVHDIAQEELGLVDPNTIIINPENQG